MSKARTVPGEDLSSRLTARGGLRARVGAGRSFYQRLGVSDPYGEDPEAEEMAKNGMFSYISASNYYRELRSQRLRMMWRIGSVRHRAVAGERLRAAGPAYTAQRTLAGASLPNVGSFVLLDHDQQPTEEAEASFGTARSVPARRVREASRAVERSVARPDVELTTALAQIASLLKGSGHEAIREVVREIPAMAPQRRSEAVREVIRTVERETSRAPAAPARHQAPLTERVAGRADRLETLRAVVADRPMAVAAGRTRTVASPTPRYSPVIEQGPTGLQPVLRSSPAVQAASESLVERIARRPEAVERMARSVYAAAEPSAPVARTRHVLPPSARIALGVPEPAVAEDGFESAPIARRSIARSSAAPRQARSTVSAPEQVALTPARLGRPGQESVEAIVRQMPAPGAARPAVSRRAQPGHVPVHQAPSVLRERQIQARENTPTGRVARSLVAQSVTEPSAPTRGLAAAGRVAAATVADQVIAMRHVEPAVTRAIARGTAGTSDVNAHAPLAGSATSWLSDALHPERGVERARRTASPARRSLAVAAALPVLEPAADVAVMTAPEERRAPAAQEIVRSRRPQASSADSPVPVAPRARVAHRAEVAPVLRPSLRAATRAMPDSNRVAASPVQSPVTVRPSGQRTGPSLLTVPGTASALRASAAQGGADITTRAEVRPRPEAPASRAVRRLERPDPTQAAIAPLLERRVLSTEPDRSPRGAVRPVSASLAGVPAAVDLVALSEDVAEQASPGTRSVGASERVAHRVARRASEEAPGAEAAVSTGRRVHAVDAPATSAAGGTRVTRELAPSAVLARAVTADLALGSEPVAEGRWPREVAHAPATRRALHRAAEPEQATVQGRAPLAASPTSFVRPVRAQRALDAADSAEIAAHAAPSSDRASTRALSRAVRVARVDHGDRALLTSAPTSYLSVAANADSLSESPVRRRFAAAPSASATLLRPGAPTESGEQLAGLVRRVASTVAANRAPALRRNRRLDLASDTDVAVRPGPARRARPALPLDRLVTALEAEGGPAEASVVTRRRDLPELASSLRQVTSSFRAAERDSVHVVSLDAARRAVTPAGTASAPTMRAVLEQDVEGRLVRARATRLVGDSAGEEVYLDGDAFGVSAPAQPEGALGRAAARGLDEGGEATALRSVAARGREIPTATVLSRTPTAWAEDRGAAAEGASTASLSAEAAASPTRRAVRRWNRPIPEGPVLAATASAGVADVPDRLTAPGRRWRGERPEARGLAFASAADDGVEEADEPARGPRRAHSANTWTELAERADAPAQGTAAARRGQVVQATDEEAPAWVRRAVEPAAMERPERESLGSTVRSGGGLMTALARAGDAEEVIRVIVQRSHMASALARELPGEAGELIREIAAESAGTGVEAPERDRAHRGEVVPSTRAGRVRGASLLSAAAPRSRNFRGASGGTATSEGQDGVGASKAMKLAGKLKKLIHLAEHDRRLDEARSQVRMAEDSAHARAEAGAGKSGGQSLEADNMHLERLREEVLQEVKYRQELDTQREGDPNGRW